MRIIKKVSLVGGFIAALISVGLNAAPTPEEIAKEAFGRAFSGMQKGTAKIRMEIFPETKKSRTFVSKAMRTDDKKPLLRYMIKIVEPAELSGMSFLSREETQGYPDQYMYTPSKKIVNRVTAGKAKARFFGSDFIYADLVPYSTGDKDTVELKQLEDTKINGVDHYVLQVTIKDPQSPYSKIVMNVRKSDMIPPQIQFYGQDKALLKTMSVMEIGADLVPVKIQMESVSGSKTILTFSDIKPNAPLSEKDFTTDAMQR